jgi:hypothetical protein
MTTGKKDDVLSAGDIAKALGASDAKVKKAIKDLAIQPAAKRGVCNLYSRDAVAKIRTAVSK